MTGAPPLRTARVGVPAAVPHGRQPLALAVLMVVLFLTFLDNTVVSVALGSGRATCTPTAEASANRNAASEPRPRRGARPVTGTP